MIVVLILSIVFRFNEDKLGQCSSRRIIEEKIYNFITIQIPVGSLMYKDPRGCHIVEIDLPRSARFVQSIKEGVLVLIKKAGQIGMKNPFWHADVAARSS